MTPTQQASALDDVSTKTSAEEAKPRASGDTPKPHGDKLAAGAGAAETVRDSARVGDSPKPHGDKLDHAVSEAAKR